jgi:DNA-binding beta-propeller fold protein YncE
VADTGNNRIELFTLRGKLLAEWSTQGWRKPSDVAMDKQGHVYVADTGNNRIVELSFSGHILRTWR